MKEKYISRHDILRDTNNEIEKIWDEYSYLEQCKYTPLTFELPQDKQHQIIEGAIVFVGINPSFDENDKNNEFYYYSNYDSGNKVDCAPVGYDLNTNDIQYFNAFRTIMKDLKDQYEIEKPWGHLDLTFIRETNQKVVENYYYHKDPVVNGFIWKQVLLSIKILEKIKPSLIVVTNAFACKVLSDYNERQLENTFNKKTGAYYLFDTPLLKSSMLSGGRALDI